MTDKDREIETADSADVRWSDVPDGDIVHIDIYDARTGESLAATDGDGDPLAVTLNVDGTFQID